MTDLSTFQDGVLKSQANPRELKKCLAVMHQSLNDAFKEGLSIKKLLSLRSDYMDVLLAFLWQHFLLNAESICLIAVGGYGRQKLFPYSDIDILILTKDPLTDSAQQLSAFFTKIWDLGFKIGQSTRTESECLTMSKTDLNIYTNLLEMRYLCGDKSTFDDFQKIFLSEYLWSNQAFFLAKEAEQTQRQSKYNETAYLLEPDIKNSQGGLRDLNHIEWLCLQHFQTSDLKCLIEHAILEKPDYKILLDSENTLARIRYALHNLNQKSDNRLFFDKQAELAGQFGYLELEKHKAIEAFMKMYFIHVKEIRALHEIVANYFYERDILTSTAVIPIDAHYVQIGNLIAQKKEVNISKSPHLLLQAFVHLAEINSARGLSAWTLCQLRKYLYLIDDAFRATPKHQQLLIRLFKADNVFKSLQLMNRHKVLGKYLPAFEHIIGQTQHDLFHLYTVDQHTLFVLKKIDTLKSQPGLYQDLFQTLEKPELLYLAALFHDIGKGRNTDHSEFGAQFTLEFSKQHNLASADGKLISWLVKNHLFLSQTAQKKDLNDPNIIAAFVERIKTRDYLTYLYLLTVADIQATNSNLWNSWKDALLKQLYFASCNYMNSLAIQPSLQQQIQTKKQHVIRQFELHSIPSNKILDLWSKLGNGYFQKEKSEHIYWHTLKLLVFDFENDTTLVATQNDTMHGATEIFICRKDCDNLFANTVLLLDRLELNVVDARIITSATGFCLDTYSVLNRENKMITDLELLKKIEKKISAELSKTDAHPKLMRRHMPRQLAHFANKIKFKFHTLTRQNLTKLTVVTPDRPGLLAGIGAAFRVEQVRVHDAKIATLNNRAEDVFYISDKQNNPFNNDAEQIKLTDRINYYLGLTCNPSNLS